MCQYVCILAHKKQHTNCLTTNQGNLFVQTLAFKTDASQPGIEPETNCTAGEHSVQTAIRTGSVTAIRNLSLNYYTTCDVLLEGGPGLDSIPLCWPPV
jgi:hypothetical protein